jgi:hypothetical protein
MSEEPTAVMDVRETPATDAYNAKEAEWQAEAARLAALQRRHAAGEKLTRDERLDKLTLEEDVELLRHEADALVAAKEAEQLALAIEAVVDVWNHWRVPQAQAFTEFVEALRALLAAKDWLVHVYDREGPALANQAYAGQVGLTVPSGATALSDMLTCLPNAADWTRALVGEAPAVRHMRAMHDKHVAAIPKDVEHVSHQVQRRRRP